MLPAYTDKKKFFDKRDAVKRPFFLGPCRGRLKQNNRSQLLFMSACG
jgi:hypothetical protein